MTRPASIPTRSGGRSFLVPASESHAVTHPTPPFRDERDRPVHGELAKNDDGPVVIEKGAVKPGEDDPKK